MLLLILPLLQMSNNHCSLKIQHFLKHIAFSLEIIRLPKYFKVPRKLNSDKTWDLNYVRIIFRNSWERGKSHGIPMDIFVGIGWVWKIPYRGTYVISKNSSLEQVKLV